MKLNTRAVHIADRKRLGEGLAWVPSTTPIHTASSFFYADMDTLDRVFAKDIPGQSYSRYGNPTNDALEELVSDLESGAGALACSSGMSALHMAINTALIDRRRVVLAAKLLYGATLGMLTKVFEATGTEVVFADFDDPEDVRRAIAEDKPGAIVMETIVNPLLRVPAVDVIVKIANEAGVPVIVDNTFATPMLIRPLELGAAMSVHSLTKYLSGHGDVLGGIVVADAAHIEPLRNLSRTVGFNLGSFEAYLAMRGVKTFPLRMERQCANACKVAQWLTGHASVDRVYYPADPKHPDAENIQRLFPAGMFGAMIGFEVKDADKAGIFRLMNALKMVVPATSLGDVHTMMLYPAMASHRDLAPKHRLRLGIKDNLVRLSVGIEAVEDIIADLDSALQNSAV
jgi:cystathionine gamma-synthase/methionine-gamma-lyase